MDTKKFAYVDYAPIKKTISSNGLSAYNVVNLLSSELEKILLEDHVQLRIKKLTTFEESVVRWYVDTYVKKADLCNQVDVDIIKKLQDIKERIFHNTRVAEDFIFIKHIDTISKSKNKQYIISALRSLEEKYRDTEYIERKLFLREQAEKCILHLSSDQQYFRKQRFDYDNLIEPVILKP